MPESRRAMDSSSQNPLRVNMFRAELSRQTVHMSVGLLSLSLRWLTHPQALAGAAGLIVFNSLILPRFQIARRHLYRTDEQPSGFSRGIVTYSISVLLLILIFPVPVAAAMWGALAFGDGLATLVGSQMGKGPLPWNRKKTVSGCVGYVCGATPSMAFLYAWTAPNLVASPKLWGAQATQSLFASPGIMEVMAISFLTAIACALLESLDTPIDDNLLAPLGGAVVMIALTFLLF